MQDKIQVFENQEFGQIRIMEIDGQPWWVLKDVCNALGIGNVTDTAKRLDCDEKAEFDSIEVSSNGTKQRRKRVVISESGLYAVILRSDKPNAKAFRKWVTSEVLPSIRKHGAFIQDDILREAQRNQEFADDLFIRLASEKNKVKALEAQKRLDAPKVRYCDVILQSPDAVQVSIIAKDYGMTAAAFNKLLHRLGVQFRMGKTWLLYQKYARSGYTLTNTYIVHGRIASIHTVWTQKGRLFLYELLKSYGMPPQAEVLAGS
jgi:prophage antirepressor-like protein